MEELEFILQEYVLTANAPEYNGDYSIINSKFPELANIDPKVLEEYVLTANAPEYNQDWDLINSKFPEFNIQPESDDSSLDLSKLEDEAREKLSEAAPTFLKPAVYFDNAVNIIKSLVTDKEERKETAETIKAAIVNVKPRLFKNLSLLPFFQLCFN